MLKQVGKTKGIVEKIKTIGDKVTMDMLSQMDLPTNMDVFLYHVAMAEGLAGN